jgi:hypothetical protein
VLLVFGAPCQLRWLAGQEHGRTIPLGDIDLDEFLRETVGLLTRSPVAKCYVGVAKCLLRGPT